jgi:hypothetical protein
MKRCSCWTTGLLDQALEPAEIISRAVCHPARDLSGMPGGSYANRLNY